MAGRTRLTGGPAEVEAPAAERYSGGFTLPLEPQLRPRGARAVLLLAVLVLVIATTYLAYSLIASGQDFDPALTDQPGVPAPVSTEG